MSEEKKTRNAVIVQLHKLWKADKSTGFSTYWLAKRFKLDTSNIIRLLKRDWEKYGDPSPEEKLELIKKYYK